MQENPGNEADHKTALYSFSLLQPLQFFSVPSHLGKSMKEDESVLENSQNFSVFFSFPVSTPPALLAPVKILVSRVDRQIYKYDLPRSRVRRPREATIGNRSIVLSLINKSLFETPSRLKAHKTVFWELRFVMITELRPYITDKLINTS